MCTSPEWAIVAVSGVRTAGTAAHGTSAPLIRAGVNPSTIAASPGKAMDAISQASAVKALIATVAVRGIRSIARIR